MRGRELAQAAKDIVANTGFEHRRSADGQRVAGSIGVASRSPVDATPCSITAASGRRYRGFGDASADFPIKPASTDAAYSNALWMVSQRT